MKKTPLLYLLLSNRGNPDHGQDPNSPIFETPQDEWVVVADLDSARVLCRYYINDHELGGSNWTGGLVAAMVPGGVPEAISTVSYNGRIVKPEGGPVFTPDMLTTIEVKALKQLEGGSGKKLTLQEERDLFKGLARDAMLVLRAHNVGPATQAVIEKALGE